MRCVMVFHELLPKCNKPLPEQCWLHINDIHHSAIAQKMPNICLQQMSFENLHLCVYQGQNYVFKDIIRIWWLFENVMLD